MQAFTYMRATDIGAAIDAAQAPGAMFLGGGTNLIDLAKGNIAKPQRLIDINGLPLADITELPDGGVRVGALAKNSDTANHPLIRGRYPLLSQALLAGASPQLRNMATTGGNLLQRTRCYYFADAAFSMCNKRIPGSGCAALQGQNRIHAIFGASGQCVAVNPSDMNVALAALDAVVRARGPRGERVIAIADFHRLPGNTPQLDTTLAPGELILSVDLPANRFAAHSHYLKVRDRASYAFALVSVAVALDLRDGVVNSARVVLGGVAHKPWRSNDAERALAGNRLERASIEAAAAAAVRDAKPLRDNAFKPGLAQRAIARALQTAGGLA